MSQFFILSVFGMGVAHRLLVGASSSSSSSSSAPVVGPGQIVNRFGEVEDFNNLRPADWRRRWETKSIGWHKTTVNQTLVKFQPRFVQPAAAAAAGSAPPSVLVPLCGKTIDLVWLYQQGYKVVGVEIITQAIIDFFTEHSAIFPTFTVDRIPDTLFTRYSTPDGRLTLFQGDIFSEKLTPAVLLNEQTPNAAFDAVWDRAALHALNPHTRARYVAAMDRCLRPGGDYLLSTNEYSSTEFIGPPFSVPEEEVDRLFAAYTRERVEIETGIQVWNGDNKPKVEFTHKSFFMKKPTA